jgi:hypothetical protein
VTLDPVTVTDSRGLLVSCPAGLLAPGQNLICTASYVTTWTDVGRGSITNTGTATGRTPAGTTLTAESTLTLPVTPLPEPVNPITPPGPPVTG